MGRFSRSKSGRKGILLFPGWSERSLRRLMAAQPWQSSSHPLSRPRRLRIRSMAGRGRRRLDPACRHRQVTGRSCSRSVPFIFFFLVWICGWAGGAVWMDLARWQKEHMVMAGTNSMVNLFSVRQNIFHTEFSMENIRRAILVSLELLEKIQQNLPMEQQVYHHVSIACQLATLPFSLK